MTPTRLPSAAGIVLAAGLSRRMGSPKPLLRLAGVPAVVRAARSFTEIGVVPVVVLGHSADDVAAVVRGEGVQTIVNQDYHRGMWSSVTCGLRALGDDRSWDWLAVLPADCALVRPETIGAVVRTAQSQAAEAGCEVVHPVYGGARGHPPLLSRRVVAAALRSDPPGGLRQVLAEWDERALEVPVGDPCVGLDMDDAEQYARSDGLAGREAVPDDGECLRLQARHAMPERVRRHCAAVMRVADALATALTGAGLYLDRRLLRSAALLHDLARGGGADDHAAAGAGLIDAAGYPRVAAVAARHMDVTHPLPALPGEAEVLYLADKLVLGGDVVTLDHRLAVTAARFSREPAAAAAAHRRLRAAMELARSVEALAETSLAGIVSGGTPRSSSNRCRGVL